MTGAIDRGIVGVAVGPVTHAVDARWLMAYAAGLGETDPRHYDTLAADGPLAHPLFPVCYEWPAAVALRDKTVETALQPRSVHATHHLVLHRLPRAGDVIHTTARVTEVAPRPAGTLVVSRFETVDARGDAISTTDYGSVYRGVRLTGSPEPVGAASPRPSDQPGPPEIAWEERVEVPATAALVYTECARIYNPIHTDVAVARAAGLANPILHGTATLALAVSRVLARALGGRAHVREVRARFTGMVPLPSYFTVRGRGRSGDPALFDVVGPAGEPVLSQGVLVPCDR